ncbi:MAG: PIN domain protein, partial [Flavisolibacter sp.]|nr:PIN domain protein [Flavisolibacter sp.]
MQFYADTSVWGGYYDKEFSEWTVPFIEQARAGRFIIMLSDVTLNELQNAPEKVRDLPITIPPQFLKTVTITDEQLTLAEHYVSEGALTSKYYTDAQHIAISTILKVDSLVSWNFQHMVNFFRIRQYNAINLKFGYQTI